MSDKDLTKRDLQKIKGNKSVFDKETLSEVNKDIDELLKELDEKLAKQKKIIEENDRKILETMSYEELLSAIRLVRV